jgi:putative lipoic acid-binding regulatory protein
MNNKEIEFPCKCNFRIIAENLEDIFSTLETAIIDLGINSTLKKLNSSGKGKYISFGFSIIVDSKEFMNKIDEKLCSIQGVKMVM